MIEADPVVLYVIVGLAFFYGIFIGMFIVVSSCPPIQKVKAPLEKNSERR